MTFQFDEETHESLMDPFYVDNPIGTEEQFEKFIRAVEREIDKFVSYKDFKPKKQKTQDFNRVTKAIDCIRSFLFSPDHYADYFRREESFYFRMIFENGTRDLEKIDAELSKISILIDLHQRLNLSAHKWRGKITPPIWRFVMSLACWYVSIFGSRPPKAGKKQSRSHDQVLESPFVNFLEHALDALVSKGYVREEQRPKDMKYLVEKALKEADFEIRAIEAGGAVLSPLGLFSGK